MTDPYKVYLGFNGPQVVWQIHHRDGRCGGGRSSIFQLADLQTAWEQDSRVQSATTLRIDHWDPQEGSEYNDAFQKLCEMIPQCMPNLDNVHLNRLPDAKMALMLLYLPNIQVVQFVAIKENYPLAFNLLGRLQHLDHLWLQGVDSLGDDHLAGLLQNLPNLKVTFWTNPDKQDSEEHISNFRRPDHDEEVDEEPPHKRMRLQY